MAVLSLPPRTLFEFPSPVALRGRLALAAAGRGGQGPRAHPYRVYSADRKADTSRPPRRASLESWAGLLHEIASEKKRGAKLFCAKKYIMSGDAFAGVAH